ncbi:hypothetical protein [Chamaesiphon minutus]|uniref:Uncharacterized protein n=1 Tax=Chamaesiphon minutus (strain ATCC 27169 / PCC 6605) TaxID=1173020 RepID=K9ULU6_CHAP6|nr:hypothetical protein [Chamaesiphon minutus]AFY96087.1 hypothetical protein Cha6605_5193 [Chamaesiphon minutus PCC 6605]
MLDNQLKDNLLQPSQQFKLCSVKQHCAAFPVRILPHSCQGDKIADRLIQIKGTSTVMLIVPVPKPV